MPDPRISHALLGAFVADAASLGLHWLYDVDRIAQVIAAHGESGAFVPVTPAHYEGAKGVFVHGARPPGALTQYGEVLAVALRCTARDGGFDVAAYQKDYAAHFGAGGRFTGYIDRPTRGTLDNIAHERTTPSGIDDDQLPALASLPAVIAVDGSVDAAVSVTNDNDMARACARIFAQLLRGVLDGGDLRPLLEQAAADAPPDVSRDLKAALDTDEGSSTAYGEITGRACHLPMAMPLIFHILARAETYPDAVERNIAAGGDSAGRSIAIGAIMGARHGIDGPSGIPLGWIVEMRDAAALWSACQRVVPS